MRAHSDSLRSYGILTRNCTNARLHRAADIALQETEGVLSPRLSTPRSPRYRRSKSFNSGKPDEIVFGRRATAAENFAAVR